MNKTKILLLALCFFCTNLTLADFKTTFHSANQGYASAQFNLGIMYDKGEGVPQSYTEAVKWYRLAAEQGHASAQNHVGNGYFYGVGVPQSDTEAFKWYRLAANQGHVSAQSQLELLKYLEFESTAQIPTKKTVDATENDPLNIRD